MLAVFQWLMWAIMLGALFFSVLYSVRYRRQQDPKLRGIFAAVMNIWMGVLLVAVGFIELTYVFSIARTVICVIFILLGMFNLFAGFRNRSHYRRRQDPS